MIKLFFKISAVLFTALNLSGQSVSIYKLDSITVTANRIPTLFKETGSNIEIISANEIKKLPAADINGLLDYSTGLDVKQRGPEGIQADLSIRGGTYEQTLILIDGIRISDPQTGHHNLNLPISITQIERIEILKGQGSRIHGANAFSGVVNIIPKSRGKNNLRINAGGGENNYYNLGISGFYNIGKTSHNLSLNRSKSDGYRKNTDFSSYNISMNNSFILNESVIKLFTGYISKDFGANSYYTIRYPEQAEKTETFIAGASAELEFNDLTLLPKVFWRRNRDEFVLFRDNPSFYKNNHETNVVGGEFQASTDILGGATSFGLEFTQDNINSNNLGEHKRQTKGFFVEQIVSVSDNMSLSAGGFAYYYSGIDWKFWPGVDISYGWSDNIRIFANYGRAFRIPTYTDLYYSDPVTEGNADLQPEETDNYELGFNYNSDILYFSGSYFRKEGKNLIDYVFNPVTEIWKARNFTKINTNGFELGFKLVLDDLTDNIINLFKIDYTYLDSDKPDAGLASRYVIEHLEHDLNLSLFHDLPFGIIQTWTISYEDRISLGDHILIDTKLNKSFSNISVFIKASNLMNKSYEEIPGVPLPGRWIIGGIELELL